METKKIFSMMLVVLSLWAVPKKPYAQNWDIDILKSINPQHPASAYWKSTSSSAYYLSGTAALGLLVYGFADNNSQVKKNSAELFITYGISTIVSESLKFTFNRARPADRYPDVIFVSSPVHGKSFPSGHTTLAFSTATTFALDFPKWYVIVPAYLWAGSVGYSRLYLGKHYPTDVLGGAFIGIGSGYLSHWLTSQIFKPYQIKNRYNE
jgi:membrane-associated phospholipid phosphatase